MQKRRLIGRVLCAMAITAALVAVPAWAHQWTGDHHGSDYAEMGQQHETIRACDGEADGNGVRPHTRNIVNNIDAWAWDTNGADPGCGIWDPIPYEEIEFRICENNVGCSAWRYE